MKVVQIRSRMLFGQFYPRAEGMVPEGVKFAAAATLALFAPVLLLCYALGHLLPLYLMTCNVALGILWGLSLLKWPPDGFISCVPVKQIAVVSSGPHTYEMRKVAGRRPTK